jgi:N-acetylated-alpha-linked acidic dipeptidase
VVFAAWGAEEFGIIGSSEWVEANRDRLGAHAVAYLNLDMAAMGTNFGASATPSLAAAVVEAAGLVPQPSDESGRSVAEVWAGDRGSTACGDLGGGSDHVGFLCHVGVPCVSLHAGGSRGTSYHSNYDTLAWYRSTVGDDYAGALMLARITAALATALADDPVPPIDPVAIVSGLPARLDRYEAMAVEAGMSFDAAGLRDEVAAATEACRAANSRISDIRAAGEVERVREVSKQLLAFERNWLDERGLTGRAWFANTFAASDRDSGYGAVVLPLVAEAIRDRDQTALDQAIQRYRMTIGRIRTAASGLARPGA